jgi:Protein of unknown function (DUF4232)
MNGRVFIQAGAAALALGATAALSGCTSAAASAPAATTATTATTATAATAAATASVATATTGDNVTESASTGASAATTTGNGGSAQNADAGVGACATGKVSVKLGAEDASSTHKGLVLLFTNTGSSTCTLTGYPGATVTDSGMTDFAPLVNATRTLAGFEGGASAVSTVSLAPGGSVSALLEWEDFPANGEPASAANCYGMAGGYLEITPPNTTVATRFDPPDDMCRAIEIHPVVPGGSGRTTG